MGQRFGSAIVPVGSEQHVYDGELMLAGWADTEHGKTVKFWLDHEASEHPFSGFGKRTASVVGAMFMGVFALLDDDQSVVDETAKAVVENGQRTPRLSSQVHLMITSPRFIQFMTERSKRTANLEARGLRWDSIYNGEMVAKAYVKKTLGIESLSDLDRDPSKADLFHETFRKRFAKWNGGDAR